MNIKTFGKCILIIVVFMFMSTSILRAESDPAPDPNKPGTNKPGAQKPGAQKTDRRIDFGVRIEDYKWAEFSDDGDKLLEEAGFLYTIAYDLEVLNKLIGWRNGGSLFLGQVDYDGQTWKGLPVKTDVLYIGTKIYLDAVPNYRFDSGLLVKGFIGIGGRWWFRDIDSTRTATGAPVSGSEEWWWCVFGRLGAGVEYPVSKELEIFTEAGLKVPIYARNYANFFVTNSPSASLEPDQEVSAFGNIGLRWKNVSVKFAYDSLRFGRSDKVDSGTFELYQPKSKADIYSLEVSWSRRF